MLWSVAFDRLGVVVGDLYCVDLLESVASAPGSLDRAHHHPRFAGWEPGRRVFVEELSAEPVTWLRGRLADPAAVLAEAGEDPADHAADIAALQDAGPLIAATVERLLAEVAAGRAGVAPEDAGDAVRASWL